MSEIDDLKNLIRRRESEIEKHTAMLEHLKAALEEAESQQGAGQKSPPRTASPAIAPFTAKYEKSSSEYVVELLSQHPGFGLTARAIMNKLAEDGKIYSFQSMTHTLKKLMKAGTLIQSAAPEGKNARFVYKIDKSAATAVV